MQEGGKLFRAGFDRDWSTTMPQPNQDAMAWVIDGGIGSGGGVDLYVMHNQLAAMQDTAEFSAAGLSASTIKLEPSQSGLIKVLGPKHQELAAFAAGTSAFNLTASPGCPLYLQFQGPSSVGPITPISVTQSQQSLSTSTGTHPHTIQIQNLKQQPIASALIFAQQSHRSWRANDSGTAKLPADFLGSAVELHSPGYFPERIQLGQQSLSKTTVTLRALSGKIEIETATDAPSVQLIPQFQLSFPLPKLTESTSSKWTTHHYPQGDYWLVRFTPEGPEAKRTAVVIPAGSAIALSSAD